MSEFYSGVVIGGIFTLSLAFLSVVPALCRAAYMTGYDDGRRGGL